VFGKNGKAGHHREEQWRTFLYIGNQEYIKHTPFLFPRARPNTLRDIATSSKAPVEKAIVYDTQPAHHLGNTRKTPHPCGPKRLFRKVLSGRYRCDSREVVETNLGAAMWTLTTRERHNRKALRYQTDLTDAEWAVIEPHLPQARDTGGPRVWPMREIVNAIFYVMRAGCPWRLLPSDLPPWGTIYRWFAALRDDGRFENINHALVMADRERMGCGASPTGAIIDNQCVKTTEAGGPRGYDAARRSRGASTTRWSTPTGVAFCSSRIRQASRIAMAAKRCYAPRATRFPSSRKSSPTAATPATRSPS